MPFPATAVCLLVGAYADKTTPKGVQNITDIRQSEKGVGIAISSKVYKALIAWEAILDGPDTVIKTFYDGMQFQIYTSIPPTYIYVYAKTVHMSIPEHHNERFEVQAKKLQ